MFPPLQLNEMDRELEAFPKIRVGKIQGRPYFFIGREAADDLQRPFSSHLPEAQEKKGYSEEVISMEVRDPQGLELFRVLAAAEKGMGDGESTVQKMGVRVCLQKE